jgi:cholesterol transport system auxiliary component
MPRGSPRRVAIARLMLGCGLTVLAGCAGSLLPKPAQPPARFTLDGVTAVPAANMPPRLGVDAPSLVVAVPRAAPGYDSARMVYLRRPHELESFAFHEWVDTPAAMLAPLLVSALQNGAGFRSVLLAPSAASAGWRLETELIRLYQDFGTQPSQVRLSLRAVLLDSATRQPIAWREFDVSVPAAADNPVAGVQATHQAARELLAAVAAFCAEEVQRVAATTR